MTPEEISRILDRLVEQAGEVTDAVQLMATWQEDGYTHHYMYGVGNLYARRGLAQSFIERDQAIIQSNATKKQDSDE